MQFTPDNFAVSLLQRGVKFVEELEAAIFLSAGDDGTADGADEDQKDR